MKLSAEERERLNALIQSGKHPARKLTRARILLKADVVRQGKAWSDSEIAAALDTGLVTVARVRWQLVEEGFEAVLTPKRSPARARPATSSWARRTGAPPCWLLKQRGVRTMDVAVAGKTKSWN